MTKTYLTEERLARLGMLDEMYDMYCRLGKVYDTAYEGFYEVFPKERLLWPNEFDKLARRECRRIIDQFLNTYSYIFTKEYSRLYTNSENMTGFSMLKVTHTKYFTIQMDIVTFGTFIKRFSDLVCNIIYIRKLRDFPDRKISWEDICLQITQSISSEERQVVENPSINEEKLICSNSNVIVFQTLSTISCNVKKHNVLPKLLKVRSLNTHSINLPVHYCEQCQKCFIGAKTLKIYEKLYGKLFKQVEKDSIEKPLLLGHFKNESLLHSLGYNVVEGKLAEKERQALLVNLLENHMISYYQVCRDLENAIRIFRNVESHQNAVRKWTEDLYFISEYVKNGLISQNMQMKE